MQETKTPLAGLWQSLAASWMRRLGGGSHG